MLDFGTGESGETRLYHRRSRCHQNNPVLKKNVIKVSPIVYYEWYTVDEFSKSHVFIKITPRFQFCACSHNMSIDLYPVMYISVMMDETWPGSPHSTHGTHQFNYIPKFSPYLHGSTFDGRVLLRSAIYGNLVSVIFLLLNSVMHKCVCCPKIMSILYVYR